MREKLEAVFDFENLAGLGPERRDGAMSIDAVMVAVVGESALIQSVALLWHDHLDESHTLSQDIFSTDGSFLHGIMHRREPDYSNAKYWFNRAGTHDAFPDILNRAKAILTDTSLAHLIKGEWDSFAMVDAVSRAKVDSKEYALLQQVQAIEVESILRPLFPD